MKTDIEMVQKLVDAIHGVRVLAIVNCYRGVDQVVKEALAEAEAWLEERK